MLNMNNYNNNNNNNNNNKMMKHPITSSLLSASSNVKIFIFCLLTLSLNMFWLTRINNSSSTLTSATSSSSSSSSMDHPTILTDTTTTNNKNQNLQIKTLQAQLENVTFQYQRLLQQQNQQQYQQTKEQEQEQEQEPQPTLPPTQQPTQPQVTNTSTNTTTRSRTIIPLEALLVTSTSTTPQDCIWNETFFWKSTLVNVQEELQVMSKQDADYFASFRIPPYLHLTTKSNCLSKPFYDTVLKWKHALPNHYSILIHDDASMNKLLMEQDWNNEFPLLKSLVTHCMISGAARADLWRALILWEYGGIYTDLDNAPGKNMTIHRGATHFLQPNDDAYLVIDNMGIPSQWFMASSPKHPLMYLNIQTILQRLWTVESIGTQYVPYVTGPGALKVAVQEFVGPKVSMQQLSIPGIYPWQYNTIQSEEEDNTNNTTTTTINNTLFQYPRTMRLGGGKRKQDIPKTWHIVIRNKIKGKERKLAYAQMGMKHFHLQKNYKLQNVSCIQYLSILQHDKEKEQHYQQQQY